MALSWNRHPNVCAVGCASARSDRNRFRKLRLLTKLANKTADTNTGHFASGYCNAGKARGDLTWLFWTKHCEKLSLERGFGHAEEAF